MNTFEESLRNVEVGGQKTRLYDSGSGRAVVVLHGWGGKIESMAPVLSGLSDLGRLLALDLPGFGEAPAPALKNEAGAPGARSDGAPWGTAEYADFVAAVLDEAGVDSADFVGHSFGAKTSLKLAASRPERVGKLVLQGSSGLRTPPSMKARLKRVASKGARFAGRFGAPGERLRRAVYDKIASEDYRNAGPMRPVLVKVVNEDFTGILPRVKAPTLLVWGSNDDAAPLAHGKTMERLIPDAGLVVFEGAGHFAYLEEPQRFNAIARHFLSPKDPG